MADDITVSVRVCLRSFPQSRIGECPRRDPADMNEVGEGARVVHTAHKV